MRTLTGIQSTGVPHLGNILGAIQPAIEMSKKYETFLFIANMHSITTFKNRESILENTYAAAKTYLALGFDTDKNYFYRQSDVAEVAELAFYLSCFFGYNRLQMGHSFKDKSESGMIDNINVGLFTYPMLMAADILLYDADIVPVGKDQKQHLEFTRMVANRFNNAVGEDIFKIPTAMMQQNVQTVPGIIKNEDGSFIKMSKSYNNTINLFETDKVLRKRIMSIQTDSFGIEDSKNADDCIVYNLYKLVASQDMVSEMKEDYVNGGVGYGHFKQRLFEALCIKYGEAREAYSSITNEEIDVKLSEGADKVRPIALAKKEQIQRYLGLCI